MSGIRYLTMADLSDADAVVEMMGGLYAEDPTAWEVDPRRFPKTVRQLVAHPEMGRIILFKDERRVHGYAILIPYWSNEHGAVVLFVDELYVVAESRGRGIGRGFFSFIAQEHPFDAVAVFLEVSATNHRAKRVYQSLGLEERTYTTLACGLPKLFAKNLRLCSGAG